MKPDLAVHDMEEAAATEAAGVAPFEDRPLAVLEEILWDTVHGGGGKSSGKDASARINALPP